MSLIGDLCRGIDELVTAELVQSYPTVPPESNPLLSPRIEEPKTCLPDPATLLKLYSFLADMSNRWLPEQFKWTLLQLAVDLGLKPTGPTRWSEHDVQEVLGMCRRHVAALLADQGVIPMKKEGVAEKLARRFFTDLYGHVADESGTFCLSCGMGRDKANLDGIACKKRIEEIDDRNAERESPTGVIEGHEIDIRTHTCNRCGMTTTKIQELQARCCKRSALLYGSCRTGKTLSKSLLAESERVGEDLCRNEAEAILQENIADAKKLLEDEGSYMTRPKML